MKKSIFLILPVIIFAGFQTAFSEQYYYEDHRLFRLPVFCGMEMNDPQLPQAKKELLNETEKAVSEWESKLVEHTNNSEDWKITYKTIPVEEQDDLLSYDCDVTISFKREPQNQDEKLKVAGGTVYLPGGMAYIIIYYLDVEYDYREEVRNGNKIFFSEPVQYNNNLNSELPKTIRHEIGHALGLGHVPATLSDFKFNSENKLVSPSIMVVDPNVCENQFLCEITPYDVRAVVSLYGEKGFSSPDYFVFLDYLIIGVPIGLLAFFIYRKKKKKKH